MTGSCGDEQRCYRAFSDALYKHPILHRSFIAHYDRCGFFQTHFAYPAATARLLRQFDASANFGRAEEFRRAEAKRANIRAQTRSIWA